MNFTNKGYSNTTTSKTKGERLPLPAQTPEAERWTVEFYGVDKAEEKSSGLGSIAIVIHPSQRGDLAALAFRMAHPRYLSATKLKFFRE